MAPENDNVGELLVSKGGIKFGDFTLTSGKKSKYYVDIKEVITDPENLAIITSQISEQLRGDHIAGVELGAVPLVVSVALMTGKPYIIIRKERKHGTGSLIIGKYQDADSVDIIEDVVTTGNSVLKAVQLLRENGCYVSRCICVVDREEGGYELLKENGVDLVPIVKISDVMNIHS